MRDRSGTICAYRPIAEWVAIELFPVPSAATFAQAVDY